MFAVDKAPVYVAETHRAAARLQEQTTPEQYARLVARAERLLEGLFTVETNVDPDLRIRIALRERFEPARVKQAILNVATWQLVRDLAGAWSVRSRPAVPAPGRPAATAV